MKIPPIAPSHSPLDPAQRAHFNELVSSLTEEQTAWVLGYFSAVGGLAWESRATPLLPASGTSDPAPIAGQSPPLQVTILYGSQTNNAANLAKKLYAAAVARGLKATLKNAADYPSSALRAERCLLMVVSTHGEGSPPDSAALLHKFIFGKRAPKLTGLRYAVLALGDSSYLQFCKAGRDFDEQLEALGGQRLVPRVDCDLDYGARAADWMDRTLDSLAAPVSGLQGAPAQGLAELAASTYDRDQPYRAPLLSRTLLNGRGSAKNTVHLELGLEGSGIRYQPGDALGVVPSNWGDQVQLVLTQQGWGAAAPVEVRGVAGTPSTVSLEEALTRYMEITAVTRPFIKAYAERGQHAELSALLEPDAAAKLGEFVHGNDILDVLRAYPIPGLAPQEFLSMLRRLEPRLYSIASSLLAHPDEVHLCVGLTQFENQGRLRKGVCSTFLGERADIDGPVPVFIQENPGFRLPVSDDAPLVMIGPGTGVAPFRAFVEEREARGARGKSWLFFGDQHFTTDFLYQLEWQRALKSGALTRMDVAFSRDTTEKVYVQHSMVKQSKELYGYLQEGAHVYVCGDAARMARDVDATLRDVIRRESGRDEEYAEELVERLMIEKRYQRDVY